MSGDAAACGVWQPDPPTVVVPPRLAERMGWQDGEVVVDFPFVVGQRPGEVLTRPARVIFSRSIPPLPSLRSFCPDLPASGAYAPWDQRRARLNALLAADFRRAG